MSDIRTARVASTPQSARVGRALAAASVIAIACATLVPSPQAPISAPLCLICGERGGVDAVLNLLLFLPLGAGLALANVPRRQAVALMTLLSAFIEAMQVDVISGRDASLGDLFFNSLGGGLGYLMLAQRHTLLRPRPRTASLLIGSWTAAWLGVQALVSYALSPSWTDSPDHVQVGHAVHSLERFPGTVLVARIGSDTVREGRIPSASRARTPGLAATPLFITVRTGSPTRRTAPVLRIADSAGRGIALIAQRGTSLLFTARTGADRLRLRPPMFEVPGAFTPGTSASDQGIVVIGARRTDRAMELTVVRDGGSSPHRLELSNALGWTLVLPAQWRLTGGVAEHLLSLLWLAGLLVPLGYWSTRASPTHVALSMVALPAGLALIPHAVRLPVASPLEWCAAMSGMALGGVTSIVFVRGATRVGIRVGRVERWPHSAATSRQEIRHVAAQSTAQDVAGLCQTRTCRTGRSGLTGNG